MNRPLIGITCSKNAEGKIAMSQHYLNSVWEAGAVPVFLAYTTDPAKLAEYAEVFDGFLFGGGDDIDPARYGETVQFDNVEVDADRDAFELGLYEHVKRSGKPVLGICRGLQVLNVAEGGTLYQHIDGHRQDKPGTETEQKTLVEVKGADAARHDHKRVGLFFHDRFALGHGIGGDELGAQCRNGLQRVHKMG